MTNHDLSTDLDLAYAKAYRDASEAAHRLALAIDDSYIPDHSRRSWTSVTQLVGTTEVLYGAMREVPVPRCRWCGRRCGDPQCRCAGQPRESDDDVVLDGPFEEINP